MDKKDKKDKKDNNVNNNINGNLNDKPNAGGGDWQSFHVGNNGRIGGRDADTGLTRWGRETDAGFNRWGRGAGRGSAADNTGNARGGFRDNNARGGRDRYGSRQVIYRTYDVDVNSGFRDSGHSSGVTAYSGTNVRPGAYAGSDGYAGAQSYAAGKSNATANAGSYAGAQSYAAGKSNATANAGSYADARSNAAYGAIPETGATANAGNYADARPNADVKSSATAQSIPGAHSNAAVKSNANAKSKQRSRPREPDADSRPTLLSRIARKLNIDSFTVPAYFIKLVLALALSFTVVYAITKTAGLTAAPLFILLVCAALLLFFSLLFKNVYVANGTILAAIAAFCIFVYRLYKTERLEDYRIVLSYYFRRFTYWAASFFYTGLPHIERFEQVLFFIVCSAICLLVYFITIKKYLFACMFALGFATFCTQWCYGFYAGLAPFTIFIAVTVVGYIWHIYLKNRKQYGDLSSLLSPGRFLKALAPLFVCMLMLISAFPTPNGPIRMQWLYDIVNKVTDRYYDRFYYYRVDNFALNTTGFSNGESFLSGPVRLNNTQVLMVVTEDPTLYLKGNGKEVYTGNSWKNRPRLYWDGVDSPDDFDAAADTFGSADTADTFDAAGTSDAIDTADAAYSTDAAVAAGMPAGSFDGAGDVADGYRPRIDGSDNYADFYEINAEDGFAVYIYRNENAANGISGAGEIGAASNNNGAGSGISAGGINGGETGVAADRISAVDYVLNDKILHDARYEDVPWGIPAESASRLSGLWSFMPRRSPDNRQDGLRAGQGDESSAVQGNESRANQGNESSAGQGNDQTENANGLLSGEPQIFDREAALARAEQQAEAEANAALAPPSSDSASSSDADAQSSDSASSADALAPPSSSDVSASPLPRGRRYNASQPQAAVGAAAPAAATPSTRARSKSVTDLESPDLTDVRDMEQALDRMDAGLPSRIPGPLYRAGETDVDLDVREYAANYKMLLYRLLAGGAGMPVSRYGAGADLVRLSGRWLSDQNLMNATVYYDRMKTFSLFTTSKMTKAFNFNFDVGDIYEEGGALTLERIMAGGFCYELEYYPQEYWSAASDILLNAGYAGMYRDMLNDCDSMVVSSLNNSMFVSSGGLLSPDSPNVIYIPNLTANSVRYGVTNSPGANSGSGANGSGNSGSGANSPGANSGSGASDGSSAQLSGGTYSVQSGGGTYSAQPGDDPSAADAELRSRYNILSIGDFIGKDELAVLAARADDIRTRYLELPETLPERVWILAEQLTESAANDYEKAEILERYLYSNYEYSLNVGYLPPGEDFVDNFLFKETQGYCTHFATALAVMARCVGLPSRYVEGYTMPPELSEDGIYRVTNAEAHAWVEIYFEGYGWRRFEPTATYQERLKPPVEESEGEYYVGRGGSGGEYRDYLEDMMRGQDYYRYSNFDPNLYNARNQRNALIAVAVRVGIVVLLLMIPVGVVLFGRRRANKRFSAFSAEPGQAVRSMYGHYIKMLEMLKFGMRHGETLAHYSERVDAALHIGQSGLSSALGVFEKMIYSRHALTEEDKHLAREVYPQLLTAFTLRRNKLTIFFIKDVLAII